MYMLNGTIPPVTTSNTRNPSSTATSVAPPSVSTPAATGFPNGWTYQGCYVDGVTGRDLSYQQPDNQQLTQQLCVETCASLNYTIAGMEYTVQCFCDNFMYNGAALAANQADCNDPCPGNPAGMCGAGNRLTVYSLGTPQVYQPPTAQTTGLPANWAYKGCLQDNIPSNNDANTNLPTFPYMVWDIENNTVVACIEQCYLFGFNAAGVEYGSQCCK
jgi:hypothetical protein